MDLGTISKAIAGALAGAAGGIGTAAVIVPAGISMPWYGYVITALVNAALGFLVVYAAPKNTPSANS